jgi:hypothetical protein
LEMPLPAPNDLEGGVSQPAHEPRSDLPELRREPLQGSSHPAVAGQSVSSMPSTASSDLDEEKAASRDYSDSAIEKKKKLIDAAKTARQALRARLLERPLPAPNDLEGGVSQPAHDPRSDLPVLRREPLQGSSHPAVAGHSVSSMPSTTRSDVEKWVCQPALECHVSNNVPSPAPIDFEGSVSQPAVEGHIVAMYNNANLSSRIAAMPVCNLCEKADDRSLIQPDEGGPYYHKTSHVQYLCAKHIREQTAARKEVREGKHDEEIQRMREQARRQGATVHWPARQETLQTLKDKQRLEQTSEPQEIDKTRLQIEDRSRSASQKVDKTEIEVDETTSESSNEETEDFAPICEACGHDVDLDDGQNSDNDPDCHPVAEDSHSEPQQTQGEEKAEKKPICCNCAEPIELDDDPENSGKTWCVKCAMDVISMVNAY